MEDIERLSFTKVCERMREALDKRPATWLAEKTGDDADDVRRWLRGDNKPPVDFVARYCEATGVSGTWLLTEKGAMYAARPGENERLVQQMRELLEIRDGRGRKID